MEKVKTVYSCPRYIYPLEKGGQCCRVNENPCVCPVFYIISYQCCFTAK